MPLNVVLHPDVVNFLHTEVNIDLKNLIWGCIKKLRERQFDRGLRVKKLKGTNKQIWEARINQASRLIYTYAKSTEPKSGQLQTYIAVRDICLDHDDVPRRAKRNSTEAHWLDSEALTIFDRIDSENLTYAEQDNIKNILKSENLENVQIDGDFVDELLGNIQWQVVESDEKWQQAIIRKEVDLTLKLSPEEYSLVNIHGNLLLSGGAGTGKTTVGLYRLCKSLETLQSGKRLYVAYNRILVGKSNEQFTRLISQQDIEIGTILQFKTIKDLCLGILSVTGKLYSPEDEVTYQVFEQLYIRKPESKSYPAALIWDEIRSIIKGANLDENSCMLSENQYNDLGKKRSSIIQKEKRHEVYKLAVWYKEYLKKQGRFDEIDIAREALQVIQNGKYDRYESIVCDEVQDFTEIQLKLLVSLVPASGSLFFAGDMHQMISPSGFRWGDLKKNFFGRQNQPTVKTLEFNFRSVSSLVNLSNQLLKLRYRLLQENLGEEKPPISNYGENARLIAAPLSQLKLSLGQLSPDDAVLVRNNEDKQKFREEFNSSFVFTIEEAKGLEFDTVFLVEFFNSDRPLWNKLFDRNRLQDKDIPKLILELNLLYVAITRPRRILNIWEANPSPIWSQEELINFVQPIAQGEVRNNQIEPDLQMWLNRGNYYRDTDFCEQAIECFEKAGEESLKLEVQVKLYLQRREHDKAVEMLSEMQDWKQAAQVLEKEKKWTKAAEFWGKTGDLVSQKNCQANGFEVSQKWESAALLWEELGLKENAKRCWLKSSNEIKKAEINSLHIKKKVVVRSDRQTFTKSHSKVTKTEFNDAEVYYRRGIERSDLGDYKGAIAEFTKAITINPKDFYSLTNRGSIRSDLGDYKGSFEDFNEVIQINPENAHAYCNRGLSLLKLEKMEEAIADFSKSIKINPNISEAYKNRGYALSTLGDHKGAIKDFDLGIRINPKDAIAYCNRGGVRSTLGDHKGAIKDYNLSVKLNPSNPVFYCNRGKELSSIGNHKRAIYDFNKAIEIYPDFANAYYCRGNARSELGDKEGAIDDFNKAIKINPNYSEAYKNRGLILSDLGDYKGALKDFNNIIKINPDDDEAFYNRGLVRSYLENYEGAIHDYDNAIKINPIHFDAYNDKGIALSVMGDKQGALQNYSLAININPNFVKAHKNRGLIRSELGDKEEAIQDFTEAIKIDPSFAPVYNMRGICLYDLGDQEGAIKDFTQAIKIDPNYSPAFNCRGMTLSALGDQEGAIKDFTQAIKIDPNYSPAFNCRGNAFIALGDQERAIKDFTQAIKIDPNYEEAYSNRGAAFSYLMDYKAAIEDLTQAIKIDPNNAVSYYNRAKAYLALWYEQGVIKNQESAIKDYKQALKINPNLVDDFKEGVVISFTFD